MEIGDQEALPHLMKVLLYWKTNARNVVRELHRIKGDDLLPALLARLESTDNEEREGVAMALGLLGDLQALEPLLSHLNDEDVFVVTAVAEALGDLKEARAMQPLLDTLSHQDAIARRAAIDSLRKIGERRSPPTA